MWWEVGRESTDSVLSVKNCVVKFMEIGLRTKLLIKGEAQQSQILRRRYRDISNLKVLLVVENFTMDQEPGFRWIEGQAISLDRSTSISESLASSRMESLDVWVSSA